MKHLLQNLILFLIISLSISSFSQSGFIELSGTTLKYTIPAIAFSSTFIYDDGSKPYLQFSKALGTSIILTQASKRAINKERPDGGKYSFPSGHVSLAFTGAAFIQKRYGWEVGVPAYLLASYVGWTRVYSNKHDYWDVIGGAIIGIGSSYLFTRKYVRNDIALGIGKVNNTYVINIGFLL